MTSTEALQKAIDDAAAAKAAAAALAKIKDFERRQTEGERLQKGAEKLLKKLAAKLREASPDTFGILAMRVVADNLFLDDVLHIRVPDEIIALLQTAADHGLCDPLPTHARSDIDSNKWHGVLVLRDPCRWYSDLPLPASAHVCFALHGEQMPFLRALR